MGNPVPGAIVGQTYNPKYDISTPDSSLVTASVAPVGPLTYSVDNSAVVSVDATTGIALMEAAGTATVSVVDAGTNLSDTVVFTVAEAPPIPTKLTLEYTLAT